MIDLETNLLINTQHNIIPGGLDEYVTLTEEAGAKTLLIHVLEIKGFKELKGGGTVINAHESSVVTESGTEIRAKMETAFAAIEARKQTNAVQSRPKMVAVKGRANTQYFYPDSVLGISSSHDGQIAYIRTNSNTIESVQSTEEIYALIQAANEQN